jgi:hypothetical protein
MGNFNADLYPDPDPAFYSNVDLDPDPASQNKTDPDPQHPGPQTCNNLVSVDKMSCLMIVLAAGVRPSFSTSLCKHMAVFKFKMAPLCFLAILIFSFSRCTKNITF